VWGAPDHRGGQLARHHLLAEMEHGELAADKARSRRVEQRPDVVGSASSMKYRRLLPPSRSSHHCLTKRNCWRERGL
jgi:hypothetical protein